MRISWFTYATMTKYEYCVRAPEDYQWLWSQSCTPDEILLTYVCMRSFSLLLWSWCTHTSWERWLCTRTLISSFHVNVRTFEKLFSLVVYALSSTDNVCYCPKHGKATSTPLTHSFTHSLPPSLTHSLNHRSVYVNACSGILQPTSFFVPVPLPHTGLILCTYFPPDCWCSTSMHGTLFA